MRKKVLLVRLLTAAAVALIACAFVSQYNWVAKITREPDASLPFYTGLVWRNLAYVYAFTCAGAFIWGIFPPQKRC